MVICIVTPISVMEYAEPRRYRSLSDTPLIKWFTVRIETRYRLTQIWGVDATNDAELSDALPVSLYNKNNNYECRHWATTILDL